MSVSIMSQKLHTGTIPFINRYEPVHARARTFQIEPIYSHTGICLFINRRLPTLVLELNIPLFAIGYCPVCQRALAHS
jgi:hypothetical protein